MVPAPDAGSKEVQLSGVFCSAANACMAVGNRVTSTLNQFPVSERWNGHRLSLLVTPSPPLTASGLDSVSCPRPALCVAVGGYSNNQGLFTLTEVWHAGKWRIVPSPSPH